MLAHDWLINFLQNRKCLDNVPDGRPLFAYRCNLEEYNELKYLLEKPELISTRAEKCFCLKECLFVLYCSEWWRRNYTGGPWKWDPITSSLGWDLQWSETVDMVAKGLRYWRRDLIQTGAGTQYFLSVACEGGISMGTALLIVEGY